VVGPDAAGLEARPDRWQAVTWGTACGEPGLARKRTPSGSTSPPRLNEMLGAGLCVESSRSSEPGRARVSIIVVEKI
jgi:hypothetical protein